MKAGLAFIVWQERSSSWGRGPQRSVPSCGLPPGSDALRPSLQAGAHWGTDCSLPKRSYPGERGPLQPPPPPCHPTLLSYGGFSLPAGLEQLSLLLGHGSGVDLEPGSGISLLLSGKQGGIIIEREKANSKKQIAKLRVSLPFQEKGVRWKHAEALGLACQTVQQPWLRPGQQGPKSDGQGEKRAQMTHPIHQNKDKSRLPCENIFPLH